MSEKNKDCVASLSLSSLPPPPTLRVIMLAPLKAFGASRVGGRPAWDPDTATRLLQLMRKLMRVKVCGPSTRTTESGRWSRETAWRSLRLIRQEEGYTFRLDQWDTRARERERERERERDDPYA